MVILEGESEDIDKNLWAKIGILDDRIYAFIDIWNAHDYKPYILSKK